MSAAEERPADHLYIVLAEADALDTFRRLPLEDQKNFGDWIGKAPDEASYFRRLEALVLAIRLGPLFASRVWGPDATTLGVQAKSDP